MEFGFLGSLETAASFTPSDLRPNDMGNGSHEIFSLKLRLPEVEQG